LADTIRTVYEILLTYTKMARTKLRILRWCHIRTGENARLESKEPDCTGCKMKDHTKQHHDINSQHLFQLKQRQRHAIKMNQNYTILFS